MADSTDTFFLLGLLLSYIMTTILHQECLHHYLHGINSLALPQDTGESQIRSLQSCSSLIAVPGKVWLLWQPGIVVSGQEGGLAKYLKPLPSSCAV